MAHRLADGVIDGSDNLDTLRALALAKAAALPPAIATVNNIVRAAVLQQLNDIYAPVSRANYDRLATEFGSVATKFTNCAAATDPETDAAEMVSAPEKVRKAWTDAEQLAHRLTTAMAKLQAAASLAGVPGAERGETLLPMVADLTGLHRRRAWECWRRTSGRTNRWGALVALGARIRAADLDRLEPYALPLPKQIKQVRVDRGVRQIEVDPEDELAAS